MKKAPDSKKPPGGVGGFLPLRMVPGIRKAIAFLCMSSSGEDAMTC